ncbi:MAG: hypothetical protein WA005_20205 [Candidatus Binataceae bacterium]
MRHFFALAVAALALGVGASPAMAGLIATARVAQGCAACSLRTSFAAIAIAAIAMAANQHRRPAAGA